MSTDTEITPPEPAELVASFPLSTTQSRCWFLEQVTPGNQALNVAVRWEVRGTVSAANLERAFAHVIDRHEILRTRIAERDGTPVQEVMSHVPFRLAQLDLRTAPGSDPLGRIDEIAHEDAARPFDLGRAGLLRVTLARFTDTRAILLIVAHQSVFDGFSIGVLGREVGIAAAAFEKGEAPDLPELPLQFGDFSLWQEEYLASGVLEEEAAYWTDTLRDAPYFEIEPDKPRPEIRGTGVAQLHLDMDQGFGPALEATAKAQGVSTYTLGAAVVSACLHRLTGASEVLFSTQIAGRADVDLEPLIGVFINNLVMRITTEAAAPISAHLSRTQKVVEGALMHQNMPFNRLVELINPVRDAARTPLISVGFGIQHAFLTDADYGAFQLISVPSHAPGAIYDLNITIIGRPGGWRMNLEYATDLFEHSTVEAFLTLFRAGFDRLFQAPDTRLEEIPLGDLLTQRREGGMTRQKRIEEALRRHPAVDQAAAIGRNGATWGFVTPAEDYTRPLETLPDTLSDFAAEALGPEDQPSGISVLARFPKTSLGDINRALLRPPKGRARPKSRPARPSAEIEATIRGHWQEVLGVSEIPLGANFFDLGGHSLLAVRVLSRLRESFGLELGIATIYEHGTLAEMVGHVAAALETGTDAEAEDWRILPLKRDGAGTPLIGINSAATTLAVAKNFQEAHPATCIRLFENDRGLEHSELSFEEIAQEYAKVVKTAQPQGPYLMYGNCVHGNLALETARVLEAQGETIAGVVMKDVWEPNFAETSLGDKRLRRMIKRFTLRLRMRQVREGKLSLSAALGSYRVVRRTGILQLLKALGVIDRLRTSDLEEEQERWIIYLSHARDRYRPKPVTFPVLHVITQITPQGKGFPESVGWEGLVDQLETVKIDEVHVLKGEATGTEALAQEIERYFWPQP